MYLTLLWVHVSMCLRICILTITSVFVFMLILSMRECPQTPALRSCTSYWLNSGNFPLPTCWSQWPEEPRTSIWRLISRICSTEVLSKWPRQQVRQRERECLCVRCQGAPMISHKICVLWVHVYLCSLSLQPLRLGPHLCFSTSIQIHSLIAICLHMPCFISCRHKSWLFALVCGPCPHVYFWFEVLYWLWCKSVKTSCGFYRGLNKGDIACSFVNFNPWKESGY